MDGAPPQQTPRQPDSDDSALFLSISDADRDLGAQITGCAAKIMVLYNARTQHIPAPTFGPEEGQLRRHLRNTLIPCFVAEVLPHRYVLELADRLLLEAILQRGLLREDDTRRYEGHLAALKPLFD